jgi:F-type H+-transporting ATPase subunit beta
MTQSEQLEINKNIPNAPETTETQRKAAEKPKTPKEKLGTIVRIAGPVLDVRFMEGAEPPIQDASGDQSRAFRPIWKLCSTTRRHRAYHRAGTHGRSVLRNRSIQHRGGNRVPVGENVLGRVIDCLGAPLTGGGYRSPASDVHQIPPPFLQLRPSTNVVETGIR